MKRLVLCLTALLLVPLVQAATLDDLRFMAGHWVSRSGAESTEEVWIEPAGGLMLGMNRTVSAKKPAFFEFLRIEESEGRITYVAQPRGQAPTRFPVESIEGKKVTFENPEHDFPQRIIYWLDGEKLCARTEGTMNGKVESEEWCWSRE